IILCLKSGYCPSSLTSQFFSALEPSPSASFIISRPIRMNEFIDLGKNIFMIYLEVKGINV
ncbi:hypothetical protein AB1L07_24985, partial [Niallia alba]|uniref:hypothetical protein n=1 Tax=Niallia alba TaxID=2729105 RepID=UPI0039A0BA9B